MLLSEFAAGIGSAANFQLFATDLDEEAVQIAREGYYTEAEVADVSPERLRRFFNREAEGYRVRRELRELILFAVHNVIKDPPFSHLDFSFLPQSSHLSESHRSDKSAGGFSFRTRILAVTCF